MEKQESSLNIEKDLVALRNLEKQLVTAEGRYRQPMLLSQIRYLKYMLNGADQLPGKDAYAQYSVLKKQLDELIIEVQQSNSD